MAMSNNFHDVLESESPPDIQTDICVVGAGACGITLARQLASESGLRVALLESGPLDFSARAQGLYKGENIGVEYFDLTLCRLRYFGGTTNHWGGFCTPATERDFQAMPGVPLTEWPITFSDIESHMMKAEADLGFNRARCEPSTRLNEEGFSYDGEPDDTLQTVLYSILDEAKIRFAQRYKPELEKQSNLDVYLNTNVTRVQVTPDGRTVQHLACKTLKGTEFNVRAKRYVLACHGIENARLLLASDDVNPNGLGNDGDFVGRCFMEHPYAEGSRLILHNKKKFPMYIDTSNAWPKGFSACLTLPANMTAEHQCLQYYCRMRSYRTEDEVLTHQAVNSLFENRNAPLQRRDIADIKQLLGDLTGTYSAIKEKLAEPDDYLLDHRIEQSPNPDSRVVLSDELDALGSRRADLNWQLSDVDIKTFQAGQDAVVARMSALNIGRFEVQELDRSFLEENVGGHYHHIGTTRMAEDSSTGVVDRDCKVFGVDNLYVVGSSVFCRSMFSGPTMAMLGFAYRLADHLKATTT